MARKRKRVVNWGPVFTLLLLVNIVFGMLFSPLTSVTRLRVEGALVHDQPRLRRIANSLQGIPFARVSQLSVESEVLALPEVRSADLAYNLFGRGLLRVQYRTPIARVANAPGVLIDPQGAVYAGRARRDLRNIFVDPVLLRPNLSLTLAWPSGKVAELCQKVDQITALKGAAVHLDARGRLWLNKDGFGRIEMGGTDKLPEKLDRLRKLLDERPDLLSTVKSLNLTDPDRPAIVLNKEGQR